ncbi:hypothetical protein [Rhabdothermincola salaria]|uniref:hypothetical protein n=1 Tax=Rhabdothermincola salaria TaxID=2903142 RepID=UPI001E5B2125|nr:hypothetical protein [Rhabdothermincola salaria]
MPPIPVDEYPLHQAPLSLAYPASSDRNFYDRCYINAHDRTGEVFLITGLGVYPNLGVIDAFACIRRGDQQHVIRMSDALGDDRMDQSVGPYRIEVLDPLKELRVVCEGDDHGLSLDLHWRGSYPAVDESPHVMRGPSGKIILDAQRFAQVGTWEGFIRVDGEELTVSPDQWVGTRDRSWGIRPVGEAEPAGRAAAEPDPNYGFWWLYCPIRMEDHALVFIFQETAEGHRFLNDALRVWPEESGRGVETLGFPKVDIQYRSGTRIPTGATITATEPDGTPLVVEIESKGYVALAAGCGYGSDPQWTHGLWKGRDWVERATYDLNDPANAAATQFGMLDHVGIARCNGQVGAGLFEHASIGRHDPSGFTDFMSVAP